jgi:uncharacterized protein with FMN-binding domain
MFNKVIEEGKALANNISINNMNLKNVKDGIYYGEAKVSLVEVKLSVLVNNHHIKEIKLIKHQNGLGNKANKIINDVVEKQSLNVDVISNASVSSKCILKAIEQALLNVK